MNLKLLNWSIVIVIATVGCNRSNNSESGKTDKQPDSISDAERNERFNQQLANLTQLARNQESDLEFQSAAETWCQVCQMVSEHFGENSWQSRNAQITHQCALQRCDYSAAQLEDWKRIKDLHKQVGLMLQQAEWQAALNLTQEIHLLQVELFGEESIQVGQTLIQMGLIESQLNQESEAVQHYHGGVRLLKRYGLGDHPELELAHAGLAALYARQKKYAPAVANQKEAARIAGAIWGQQSPTFAAQANQLGVMYHQAGNLEVAADILKRTLEIRKNVLGAVHPAFAHSCVNLAVVLLDQKMTEAAFETLTTAMGVLDEVSVAEDAVALLCKSQLATVYMLQKQPQFAEPLLREIVDAFSRNPEKNRDELLAHTYRLAIALSRQAKYEQARPLLEHLLQEQTAVYGESDGKTIATLQAYALLLERTDQPQAADKVRNQIQRVVQLSDSNDFNASY